MVAKKEQIFVNFLSKNYDKTVLLIGMRKSNLLITNISKLAILQGFIKKYSNSRKTVLDEKEISWDNKIRQI